MRYGVFSDVHSNEEAFLVAIDWLRRQKIDSYIFIGDIVGYGASPVRCIRILKQLNAISVAGNHDWAVGGRIEPTNFNLYARQAVLWTREVLDDAERLFLWSFPLVHEDDDFYVVHGSLIDPARFHYVLGVKDAVLVFDQMKKKICFIGHSHRQEVYIQEGESIFLSYERRVEIKKGSRYIVNVGSVGQPRDGDPRGCVCVYDVEENVVEFHRFEYNIKKAADRITKAGLPSFLAERLYYGR